MEWSHGRQARNPTPYPPSYVGLTEGPVSFLKIVFSVYFLGHEDRILGGTSRRRPSPFWIIGEYWFLNDSVALVYRACGLSRSNVWSIERLIERLVADQGTVTVLGDLLLAYTYKLYKHFYIYKRTYTIFIFFDRTIFSFTTLESLYTVL